MAETWDESKPAGGRSPTLGDDDVREFKRAIRERLAIDHDFEATESPAFGAALSTIGKHKFVTLVQRNTSKVTGSSELAFVCKEVSGSPEVLLTPPSAGADRQLTKNAGANFNLNSGDFEDNLIKSGFYDTGSIDGDDIAALAVKTANIDNYAIGGGQLATGCIVGDKIPDNSIALTKIVAEAAGNSNYYSSGYLGGTAFGSTTTDYPTYHTAPVAVRFSFPGTLRFYTGYYLNNSAGGTTGYYRVLKNGSPILGWTLGSSGWYYRTDDIVVVSGDYLQFEYCVNPGDSIYSVNMKTNMRGLYRTSIHNIY